MYVNTLQEQTKQKEFQRMQSMAEKKMEILEVEKEIAEYKVHQQKLRQQADEKKKRCLEMMISNLENQN